MFKSFWGGLIIGGLVGTAIGMIMAPASGRENRGKVTNVAHSASGKITKMGRKVSWKAQDAFKAIKQAI